MRKVTVQKVLLILVSFVLALVASFLYHSLVPGAGRLG